MQERQTTISAWAGRIMEACWLLALIMIPIYFSLLTARHFEPDKAVTLRSLMLVLSGAWLIKVLERGQAFGEWPRWRDWRSVPMLIPTLIYVAVFLLASLISILPRTSFMGGYNRLQGFFTNISYIILATALIANLRRRSQFERLITVAILAALPVAGYGLIQNMGQDPLPWKGDVITRVASTMGNSIFVAAYLILILPLVLYRLVAMLSSASSPQADRETPAWLDLSWAAALLLLVLGQLAILNGVLKLGALLYSITLATWWLYPFAVIAVGSSFVLCSTRLMHAPRRSLWPYLPGLLLVLLAVLMLAQGLLTAPSCQADQAAQLCLQSPEGRGDSRQHAVDFGTWLLLGYGAILLFYVLLVVLPRRSTEQPSRLLGILGSAAMALVAGLLMLVTVFTQSRGPMLGMLAGLLLFGTLVLIQARRSAGRPRTRQLASWLLGVWVLIGTAGIAFLIVLNTVPGSFPSLRSNRYINRLGTLQQTSGGTGKVRILIWRGDEVTRGAVDLITANPLRTIIGWGPETMFVAYNPYYPPDLGHYESRGASPDRSHQALLDELANKGALGLFSYLLLYGAFVMLMLRFLRVPRWLTLLVMSLFALGVTAFFVWFLESPALGMISLLSSALAIGLASYLGYDRPIEHALPFVWQVFFIASLAVIVSNFVETFFGIPIVSSLLYTWTTMGLAVVGGSLAGIYVLERQQQPEEATEPAAAPAEALTPAVAASTKRARRQARASAAANQARGRPARSVPSRQSAPIRWVYPLLSVLILLAMWFWSLDIVYADMRFNQGQQWSQNDASMASNVRFERELLAYSAFSDALKAAPNEDLYYLYFGRSLLGLAQIVGQEQVRLMQEGLFNGPINQPADQEASLEQLLRPGYNDVLNDNKAYTDLARWFIHHSSFDILNYARLSMEQASQLSPLNKDHYANLGRIYATWHRSTKSNENPEQQAQSEHYLDLAIESYARATAVAPQDVALLGQYASLVALRDPKRAEEILRHAIQLDRSGDPGLGRVLIDNYVRLGEALRAQGRLQEAAEQYAIAVSADPNIFGRLVDIDPSRGLEQQIRKALAGDAAALQQLAKGYEQFLERNPTNLGARLTYSGVLSDALDYLGALEQAQLGLQHTQEQLQAAQTDRRREELNNLIQRFQQLISYLQQRPSRGG